MVMVAARTDERGIGAQLLHHFEAKHLAVEVECLLQIRHIKVDVPDSDFYIDRASEFGD